MLYSGLSAQQIRCGTEPLNSQQSSNLQAQISEYLNNNEDGFMPANSVHIWFHVILDDEGGDVTNAQLIAQVERLNLDFAGTSIGFVFAGVDRHYNPVWANNCASGRTVDTGAVGAMKKALAVDPNSTYNVYIVQTLGKYNGIAEFPTENQGDYHHGVLIIRSSLPGGSQPFHLGRTLVHETGHYFGLLHTFSANDDVCEDGDGFEDTPIHKANYGCPPETENSCPGGDEDPPDPVHNFMNYVDDPCMWEFTPMQKAFMLGCSNVFRTGLRRYAVEITQKLDDGSVYSGSSVAIWDLPDPEKKNIFTNITVPNNIAAREHETIRGYQDVYLSPTGPQ